jgi:indole-3-glycerol phosphate synthase
MILQTIVERKRSEVAELRCRGIVLPEAFKDTTPPPHRGFHRSLVEFEGVAIIAEVKKASPSKGVICADFQPTEIAANYYRQGAQAISVLTDVDFFQGSLGYLMEVRREVPLPVLRKDFIIDELQIEEARAHGADAILLIAAILDTLQLRDFRVMAEELGMDVLVEVHDEEETERALRAESRLIGINNRNLNTFVVDIATTFRLKKLIPKAIPVVSESGLQSAEDFRRLRDEGIAAALVGESLMRAGSGSDLLRTLRE